MNCKKKKQNKPKACPVIRAIYNITFDPFSHPPNDPGMASNMHIPFSLWKPNWEFFCPSLDQEILREVYSTLVQRKFQYFLSFFLTLTFWRNFWLKEVSDCLSKNLVIWLIFLSQKLLEKSEKDLTDTTYCKSLCICIFYLASKKLANFCKQFSHFEIIKMTWSLKLNSRLIVSLIFFYEFASLLNYASNSNISEKISFCS